MRLHQEGMSIRAISRSMGVGRQVVTQALRETTVFPA
ncbi:hypothetical protein [uncultured Tessaracoccus sp.]